MMNYDFARSAPLRRQVKPSAELRTREIHTGQKSPWVEGFVRFWQKYSRRLTTMGGG